MNQLLALLQRLFGRAQRPETPSIHWVCAREGLVRFGPKAVVLHPWDAVIEVSVEPSNIVRIRLAPDAHVDFFAMQPGTRRDPYIAEIADGLSIPSEHFEGSAQAFSECVSVARDPEARRALPTFYQPDGPPEAVLAGVD